ncbi:MAG: hypothetical protein JJ992_19810, partial [Planctomycetes bacterium]|nr:hypothetical protein [Planctomycetota bacterium]
MKNDLFRWLPAVMACCFLAPDAVSAAVDASRTDSCRTDWNSGVALPRGPAGVCVTSDYESTTFVQRLDGGIVFSLLSKAASDASAYDAAGQPVPGMKDRAARVIYCPLSHVDPATGMPDAACIADLQSMTPGPRAFTGQAAVAASLTHNEMNQVNCPGSIRVTGEVAGPDGSSYDFRSTAVVTRSGDDTCAVAYDAMELRPRFDEVVGPGPMEAAASDPYASYRRLEQAAEALDRLAATEGDGWHAVDQLAEMDDDELALMRWYLTADAQALERLDALLAADEAAIVGNAGSVRKVASTGDLAAGEILVTNGLASDIKDRVNAIYSRVVGIASRINIVPVRNDVVALIDKLRGAVDLQQIGERITDVGEELQDFADEIRARREGLPNFVGNDCDAQSSCGRFRQDLGHMFDNLEQIGYAIQQMVCSEIPSIETRTIEFTVIRNILVEKQRAPKVVLFLMSRILDQFDGWQLDGLVGALPTDALESMCAEARGTNSLPRADGTYAVRTSAMNDGTSVVRTSPKNSVCSVLRPESIGIRLKRSIARAALADWSVKQLDAQFPDD